MKKTDFETTLFPCISHKYWYRINVHQEISNPSYSLERTLGSSSSDSVSYGIFASFSSIVLVSY